MSPHNKGEVIEVAKASDIRKALKDQGVIRSASSTGASARHDNELAKRKLNAKVESAARRQLFDAIRSKLGEHIHIDDWRMIAARMWEEAGYADVQLLAAIWAPLAEENEKKRTDTDRHAAIGKRIQQMTAADLGHFLLDVLMAEHIDVGEYSRIESKGPLFELATRYEIDMAKLRSQAKADHTPKKKTSEQKPTKQKRPGGNRKPPKKKSAK